MIARDVMTTRVVTVAPEMAVRDIARLLIERRISAVPVVDAGSRLVGIVSEGDLMLRPEVDVAPQRSWWLSLFGASEAEQAAQFTKRHGLQARDVMTKQVVTVSDETPLGDIARLLEERRIKRVPVVRDGALVGIVSRADLLRALASAPTPRPVASDQAIREALLGVLHRESWAPHVEVNVTVRDGVVHLWGLIDSDEQRRALTVAAQRTDGVRGVEDHLGAVPPYLRGT